MFALHACNVIFPLNPRRALPLRRARVWVQYIFYIFTPSDERYRIVDQKLIPPLASELGMCNNKALPVGFL